MSDTSRDVPCERLMRVNVRRRETSQTGSMHVEQMNPGFVRHDLDATHQLFAGTLPAYLMFDDEQFEELWNEHPDSFHEIMMHGRLVKTPRWQQAYGMDYHYTGNVNRALDAPLQLEPLLRWCQETFDERLNGILLNWYDGSLGHYIGAHRDSTVNMHDGAPIVTVSLGGERVFRLRPWNGRGMRDFPAPDGTVFVMPMRPTRRGRTKSPDRNGSGNAASRSHCGHSGPVEQSGAQPDGNRWHRLRTGSPNSVPDEFD